MIFQTAQTLLKNKIIDGNKIAKKMVETLKSEVQQSSTPPKLSILLAGDNVASESYVKKKIEIAK